MPCELKTWVLLPCFNFYTKKTIKLDKKQVQKLTSVWVSVRFVANRQGGSNHRPLLISIILSVQHQYLFCPPLNKYSLRLLTNRYINTWFLSFHKTRRLQTLIYASNSEENEFWMKWHCIRNEISTIFLICVLICCIKGEKNFL